jgi:hypothetical protein
MAFVQTSPLGVTISRQDKQQQIFLSRAEWSRLVVHGREITSFMDGAPLSQGALKGGTRTDDGVWWFLSDGGSKARIRLTLNLFNAAPYCGIRVFVGETASKQGVMLNRIQWHAVRGCLGLDAEADLARDVFTKMLREKLMEGLANACEGCVQDWPSQTDHVCLVEKKGLSIKVLSGSQLVVEPYAFQVRLAELASLKGVMLSRPADAYSLCNELLREDIEASLLAEQGEDCP